MKLNNNLLRNKRGFTLLEVLIVIVILGVIAGLAVPVYTAQVEKSRSQEAIQCLATVRDSIMRYFSQNNSYAGATLTTIDYNPNTVTGGQTINFTYSLAVANPLFTASAVRNAPLNDAAHTITLTQAGVISRGSAYL